eukprot:GILJ01001098.1.p1 GENE.GILJ01001098.1~~GILJ01001098.1.p1  ORF type:complete len:297 (-),score=36.76 GILJ01001098.1:107-997(-)
MASSAYVLEHQYGKTKVRVAKVVKTPTRHDIYDMEVEVLLDGDFETSFTEGSNTSVVPTDTMRNTCYVFAKKTSFNAPEDYALALSRHFLSSFIHVKSVKVAIVCTLWSRIVVGGEAHQHAFTARPELRTVRLTAKRTPSQPAFQLWSGVKNLKVLKTTQSGFEGYIKDQYTTLPETHDRLFATNVTSEWAYRGVLPEGRFNEFYDSATQLILEVFAGPARTGVYSPSVQKTQYDTADAILRKHPEVSEVYFQMPNIHYIQYDLKRFKLENNNEVFHATQDPSGLIECTVKRPSRL